MNSGDGIDYHQRYSENIGDLIEVSTVLSQYIRQGIVDGSASKPAPRQDTGYMVEKTHHDIAPYLGAFGAYLMPQ